MLPTKVFVIHGLSDTALTFQAIRDNLQFALDTSSPKKFVVDAGFTSEALPNRPDCVSISIVGQRVADYVRQNITQGQRVAFIGHSMGGLMIRSLLVDNLLFAPFGSVGPSLPTPSAVVGMVTLGTPHLGAPTEPELDGILKCYIHLQEMQSVLGFPTYSLGDAMAYGKTPPSGVPFLNPLRNSWNPLSVNNKWLAAAGGACRNATRTLNAPVTGLPFNLPNGCLDIVDVASDGAVCRQSATVSYPAFVDVLGQPNFIPSERYYDAPGGNPLLPGIFRHATTLGVGSLGPLMCGNVGTQTITDPNHSSVLFLQIVSFLNGL